MCRCANVCRCWIRHPFSFQRTTTPEATTKCKRMNLLVPMPPCAPVWRLWATDGPTWLCHATDLRATKGLWRSATRARGRSSPQETLHSLFGYYEGASTKKHCPRVSRSFPFPFFLSGQVMCCSAHHSNELLQMRVWIEFEGEPIVAGVVQRTSVTLFPCSLRSLPPLPL